MTSIMGIVNLTPDSFFESSRAASSEDALRRIRRMVSEGAQIIDLGAVSTRPGAADVDLEEEWKRLEPVLEAIAASEDMPRISIDTTRAEIVRRAYQVIGDFIVNDISAGEDDPMMLPTVAELGLSYVAMHKRGNPRTMDSLIEYDDVVEDVLQYFRDFAVKADALGIKDWIVDPGFGFAKNKEQNLQLMAGLSRFKEFGRPLLIGIADKRFTEGRTEELHLEALRAGADILRVHDVKKARQTVGLYENLLSE